MRCDAGRGCAIDCPGGCVARWDYELNLCERACLGAIAQLKPMRLGRRFGLSLHGASGPQTRRLFDPYLPPDLGNALDRLDERIDLEMRDATVDDLIVELEQLASGAATL